MDNDKSNLHICININSKGKTKMKDKQKVLIIVIMGSCILGIMFLIGCTSQPLTDAGETIKYEGKETVSWAQDAQTKLQNVFTKIDEVEKNIQAGITSDRVGEFKTELDTLIKEIANIDFSIPVWRGQRIERLGGLIARYGGAVPMEVSDETYSLVCFNLASAVERIEKLRGALSVITTISGGGGLISSTGWIALITAIITAGYGIYQKGKRKDAENTIGDYGVGIENIKNGDEQKNVKDIIRKRQCLRTKSNAILQKALTDARAESEVETNKTGL
jgi:hypothetical protein